MGSPDAARISVRPIAEAAIDEYIAQRALSAKFDAVLHRVLAEEAGVLERLAGHGLTKS